MKTEVKDKIEILIDFIKDLVNEENAYAIDYLSAEYYFLNGGCLEFAKVLNHYIKEAKIVINNDLDHFAIYYQNQYYDVRGKIQDSNFSEVTEDYLKEFQCSYGRNVMIQNFSFDMAIIRELNNWSSCYVKKLVSSINS